MKKASGCIIILVLLLIGLTGCSEIGSIINDNNSLSNNANLSSLKLSKGNLTPSFDPYVTGYYCDMTDDTTLVNIVAETDDSGSKLIINGITTQSGIPSSPIQLTQDHNIILIEVISSNSSYKSYSVDIIKKTSTPTVSPVTFSHPNGTLFNDFLDITLSSSTSGASIYYTTNGSTPSASSTPYSASIHVTATQTIKAIAVKSGMIDSAVTSALYTKSDLVQAATPSFSPGNGTTFTSSLTVTITSATAGASIYYTLDGSAPTVSSTLYSAGIDLSSTATVKAIAVKSGMADSTVSSATYTKISQVATPVISPNSGTTFPTSLEVTITCATAGASIYYTLDGNNPTASSTPYSGPFSITATSTVKAIAVKSGMVDSQIASSSYTKETVSQVADPVFTPGAGTYDSTQTVAITSATAGASIRYTMDGTAPTSTTGTLYTGGISISSTKTVKAIAYKSGMTDSQVITQAYVIQTGTSYYAVNPNGQKGKYKTGMNVTCTSMKSDGFTDWSSDLIIAQGVANDIAMSFKGGHEAPIYDTYALYAAWDDTNLYLGWQYVNVVDVVDPAQGYPISDNGKPWNGDIRITIAFDLDPAKNVDGSMTDGRGVWDGPGILNNSFNNGLDALINMSSKPGVGTPGLFFPNTSGKFTYTDPSLLKGFTANGIVYGYVDGLLPANVYGINKNSFDDTYKPADLLGTTGYVDFLTKGHAKTQDTFYEMKIPFAALGITKSYLETSGIGIMLISTFGASAIGSIPYDDTVYDKVEMDYSADTSTSKEKEDPDTFTFPMARIGK